MATREMRDLFYTLRYSTVLTCKKYRKRETAGSLIAAIKSQISVNR